ncbi:Fez1 [Nesidiocoris tenuis]|uniref:Fez1 n=1 Tax=Nesidiocoris tenuis TaxID=355587 RepID=A0ABN7BFW5_9HEMI|nr:Fez1 [Nesidiocoris tenuis]
MSRVDSGNESQEGSPDTTASEPALLHTPPRLSANLTQGKVVIRPVAYKPSLANSRFSTCGQRYGSTPILARPNSRLTLYGSSTELWRERKTTVSPSLAMSSLPSDCGRLHAYDSLDSVYKASVNTRSNRGGCRQSINGSVSDLTPSPCNSSALTELEGALRERDSELQYLRQTMEHNERVIFRVYEEKERAWEREKCRLKALHESRLKSSAQRAHKLEQMLMMHTYQLQQDKKRLRDDMERTEEENIALRKDIEVLRTRLEETEWGLCQKSGELALLKSKLKETQNEAAGKVQEIISLKSEVRELKAGIEKRDEEIENLSLDLRDANSKLNKLELEKYNRLNEEISNKSESRKKERDPSPDEEDEIKKVIADNNDLEAQLKEIKETLAQERLNWEQERNTWANEKTKVLDYQKQLQFNYVQMYRKTQDLEHELETVTKQFDSHDTMSLPTMSHHGIHL